MHFGRITKGDKNDMGIRMVPTEHKSKSKSSELLSRPAPSITPYP